MQKITLGFIVFLLSITVLVNHSFAQCTSCNATNQSISGTQTLTSGQKWCYTTSNSPAYSTSLTVNGTLDVCSGATLDLFGSLSINTGRIYLYDCSKIKLAGSFTDFGTIKITAYCSSCGGSYTPLSINGSAFSRVTCLTTLPIELLYFKAQKIADEIVFNWATLSEINNDFFTIEKSVDGENWVDIAKVKGAGNSNNLIEYNNSTINSNENVLYFRLKQSDFDGKFSYSQIAIVENSQLFNFSVVPNPSYGEINVTIPSYEEVTLVLYDITGKTIESTILSKNTDFQASNTIHYTALPIGIYTLSATTESGITLSKKLVVGSNN